MAAASSRDDSTDSPTDVGDAPPRPADGLGSPRARRAVWVLVVALLGPVIFGLFVPFDEELLGHARWADKQERTLGWQVLRQLRRYAESPGMLATLVALLAVVGLSRRRHEGSPLRRGPYVGVGVALVLSWIFSALVHVPKSIFQRLRPDDYSGLDGWSSFHWSMDAAAVSAVSEKAHWDAFPSGHTTVAFAMLIVVIAAVRMFRCGLPGVILAVAAGVLAVAVAVSRIVTLDHYLSDVMVAAWLGVLFGVISWTLASRLRLVPAWRWVR